MTAGRDLPPRSVFADDDGAADPEAEAVLRGLAAGDVGLADVVAVLAGARVLVPLLAAEEAGPEGDRHASAGVVAVAAPDGRTALPVFTSVGALAAWHPRARPVPVPTPRAAAAAVEEGWDLLVVDPAGPVIVVVPRPAVRALATGERWQPAVVGGRVREQVRDAVGRALEGTAAVLGAEAVPGERAEVAVVLTLRSGLSRSALDGVLTAVGARLTAVADLVDSLELRVRSPG